HPMQPYDGAFRAGGAGVAQALGKPLRVLLAGGRPAAQQRRRERFEEAGRRGVERQRQGAASLAHTTSAGARRQPWSGSVSTCKVAWPMLKRAASPSQAACRKWSPSSHLASFGAGRITWAVSAVSVVLIAQMCRSWISVTPGCAASQAR